MKIMYRIVLISILTFTSGICVNDECKNYILAVDIDNKSCKALKLVVKEKGFDLKTISIEQNKTTTAYSIRICDFTYPPSNGTEYIILKDGDTEIKRLEGAALDSTLKESSRGEDAIHYKWLVEDADVPGC